MKKIFDVMSPTVELAAPSDSIQDAAMKMAKIDAGILPVGEGDRLVGMVTDRDLAVRAVAQGRDPATTRVHEVMTEEVKYCFADEDVNRVADNMGALQLRRLPVVDRKKRLVGIVSLADIATEDRPARAGKALGGIAQPGGQHTQAAPQER
jgi:CBS domain-containing protein